MASISLDEQKAKMFSLCEDYGLSFSFCVDEFPIVMTVAPADTAQESLELDGFSEAKPDREARIQFVFKNDLVVVTRGEFRIADDMFNKLKNGAKRLHYLFLQEYFCQSKELEARAGGMAPDQWSAN